jgi:hypothetical protein
LLLSLLLLTGCATVSPSGDNLCGPEPIAGIETSGGAEDIVALPLGGGGTRLFVREACHGEDCRSRLNQIGTIDIRPGADPERKGAWRPLDGQAFSPFGISLLSDGKSDDGWLFVIDDSESRVRIWRIGVTADGLEAFSSDQLWVEDQDGSLEHANDLQALGDDLVYVTRYDFLGFLPWRTTGWKGVARVQRPSRAVPHNANVQPYQMADIDTYQDGFRGANGIVDPGGDSLIVADYWGRQLRFVSKTPGGQSRVIPLAPLGIYPDNLTLDRERNRLLIAGQRSYLLAAPDVLLSLPLPSPSAVYEIDAKQLHPGMEAEPKSVWAGGSQYGRSVSVAAPVPGGLALGQIRTPDILLVNCPRR